MKVPIGRERGIGAATAPPSSTAGDFHLFDTDDGPHLLIVDGSQIYKIDEALERQLKSARALGGTAPVDPPVRALSLAVAERCNLGCTYCYAEGGSFGGTPRGMSWEVAVA